MGYCQYTCPQCGWGNARGSDGCVGPLEDDTLCGWRGPEVDNGERPESEWPGTQKGLELEEAITKALAERAANAAVGHAVWAASPLSDDQPTGSYVVRRRYICDWSA